MTIIKNPKKGTGFYRFNNRLSLFQQRIDLKDYWQKYWKNSAARLQKDGQKGNLGEYELIFLKYINKSLPVLEAGCGPAQIVIALSKRGYNVLGIDYEPDVIKFTKERYPDLKIEVGDITDIKYPTGYFGSYISLGVVEHFIYGPIPAIQESWRVLNKDGMAFITIPYLNPSRAKFLKTECKDLMAEKGLTFHQYYYSDDEFCGFLKKVGYKVIETYPYAVTAFLTREHPFFSTLWPRIPTRIKKRLLDFFGRSPLWFRRRYGHMIMYVCSVA